MENKNIYEYITTEETAWKTDRVQLTNSKTWNMSEHIERCYNVSNGWFHKGDADDENRPYDDLVTPVIDVAFRLEGFDVKDITLFVDDVKQNYKSFILKKLHPQFALKNHLDTIIDEVVETSIIYDLVLIKDNNGIPENIKLQKIAFCDQTEVLSAPICFKHQYSIQELLDMKGKWIDDKIDEAIIMARASKDNNMSDKKENRSNGKFIEVYELHGLLPENWLREDGNPDKYVDQMHIVCYWLSQDGKKNGLTLYKGKSKRLTDIFYALKIDNVRGFGRACGKSIVERLFQPQTWNNYSAIKLKKMMDGVVNLLQSDSLQIENQKVKGLSEFTILKTEQGKTISRVDMGLQNTNVLTGNQEKQFQNARLLGSASEGALGINPSSGTPFALQELIVNQGEGTHSYRQGKIATWFAETIYPKIIMPSLMEEINTPKEFSEELSLDEITQIADTITENIVEKQIEEMIFEKGQIPTEEDRQMMKEAMKEDIKGGKTSFYQNGRGFFETFKEDFKDAPIKVKVNIAGKQKYLAREADKLSKLISMVIVNPQTFAQVPGLAKSFNQLIEASGMNPIDFSSIVKGVQMTPDIKSKQLASPVGAEEIKKEQ